MCNSAIFTYSNNLLKVVCGTYNFLDVTRKIKLHISDGVSASKVQDQDKDRVLTIQDRDQDQPCRPSETETNLPVTFNNTRSKQRLRPHI